MGLTFDVDVANTPSYGQQGGMVERGQADLNRTGVVEATVGAEVDVQALSQWREALHALRAVEERRRARDHQVEPGYRPASILLDPLPEGVQALLAGVGAHALERFHLVQHHHQAGKPLSRRMVSRPTKKLVAPKWSRSPLMPAVR